MSAKRPAFQWYPGDFRRDTALQSCPFEARALWREMLDLMHDGEPYGHLTAGGVPISDAELARLVGIPPRKATAWLFELESRKVFSRTEGGVIYSRRMVRDEVIRNTRAAGGKLGGNPNLVVNQEDNLTTNLGPKQKPTPAVAVASAVASASQKLKKGRNGKSATGEAALILLHIRQLAGTPPAGIPKSSINELGPGVLRAYEAVGGWDRVVKVEGRDHGFLTHEFAAALEAARQ